MIHAGYVWGQGETSLELKVNTSLAHAQPGVPTCEGGHPNGSGDDYSWIKPLWVVLVTISQTSDIL